MFDGHGGSAAAEEARRYRCNIKYLISIFKTKLLSLQILLAIDFHIFLCFGLCTEIYGNLTVLCGPVC